VYPRSLAVQQSLDSHARVLAGSRPWSWRARSRAGCGGRPT